MGKIRSAWEIALEKTADIQLDKEKYQHDAELARIRKIAGGYLSDDEGKSLEEITKELAAFSATDLREALSITILQSLSLPQEEVLDDRYGKIEALAAIATRDDEQVKELLDQLVGFLKQYPLHRKDLLEKMKAQYKPVLEEKAAQLSKQYGTEIHLNFENDKEFIEAARQNLERLEAQYQATLTNAKKQMAQIAGTV